MISKNYFSVIYDIERPWNKKWHELKNKKIEELSDEEKKELDRRKKWDSLIGSFVGELQKIGFRINMSVFLIPENKYNIAKSLVETYKKRFDSLNVKNDIYVLRYHPDSNQTLLIMLKKSVECKLKKYLDKYKETDDKNKKKILYNMICEVLNIVKSFDDIYSDVIRFIEDYKNKNDVRDLYIPYYLDNFLQ